MQMNHRCLKGKWALLSALALAFVFTGCSSMQTQMPEYIGSADTAVRMAKADKADEYAPTDLEMAEKKLKAAKDMYLLKSRTESLYLAQKATMDAKVASATAENVQLDSRVDALRSEVSQLNQRVEQKQTNQ